MCAISTQVFKTLELGSSEVISLIRATEANLLTVIVPPNLTMIQDSSTTLTPGKKKSSLIMNLIKDDFRTVYIYTQ